jgi:hypothetical protein
MDRAENVQRETKQRLREKEKAKPYSSSHPLCPNRGKPSFLSPSYHWKMLLGNYSLG